MTDTEVLASIAGEIHASEDALDQAIVRTTALVQSIIGSRATLNVSAMAGAEAQAKAMEAIATLSAARQSLIACHEQLAKDHRRLGYGVYADFFKDKPERPPTTGENRLRAV